MIKAPELAPMTMGMTARTISSQVATMLTTNGYEVTRTLHHSGHHQPRHGVGRNRVLAEEVHGHFSSNQLEGTAENIQGSHEQVEES